ncbi:MAG: hypothetical protein LBL35_04035 [Clostridiales bacterium]|nr:hypothetical protein [Clostridiales bacterium]
MKHAKIIKFSLIGIAAAGFLFFATSVVIRVLTPDIIKPSLMNGNLYIYEDFGSSYNHYRINGLISSNGQQFLVSDLDKNSKDFVYSGETSIRCQVDVLNDSYGGWLFAYGYFGPFAPENNMNWGKYPNCGYDLTGAKSLTFVARGKTGGERVEFFFGGLGWNLETGKRMESHADSAPKQTLGVVRLTDEFTEYTIPLEYADLSYISSGFGFVVSGNYNDEEVVFYLDDIKVNFSGQAPAQPEKALIGFGDIIPVVITAIASITAALLDRNAKIREGRMKKMSKIQ